MDGKITTLSDSYELRFERVIAQPVDKIWVALVTPERVADWLAACEIEPWPGGRYALRFREPIYSMEGVIRAFEPPNLLEYTWPEPEHRIPSIVRFLLVPHGAGCFLRLTQTWPREPLRSGLTAREREEICSILSGWHMHLDRLPASIDGVANPIDHAREAALAKEYSERLGA